MLENEITLRLGFFFGILIFVLFWQEVRPKRKLLISKEIRWFRNLALIGINNLLLRLVVPFTAVSTAVYAEQQGFGLLHKATISAVVMIVFSVIILDLVVYLQHVVFHRVPMLWRLHKIHHIDQEIDVTTGLRFHPIEIIISMFIKCATVVLFGVPVIAVVIFEIILNATAMFNHGNIRIPQKLDRFLRLIVVTPDMHRVHHSVIVSEANSNFGFNLPWWDRIFATYIAQPQKGHQKMKIGLEEYQNVETTGLIELLVIPFKQRARE